MRAQCVAFAFDIKGFFDNIDHKVLKKNWCEILGVEELPADHYNVYRNLTKFSAVDRRALLKRLGHDPSARDRDLPVPPLCSGETFRQLIRGNDGEHTNLVVRWKRSGGIPQGSPISAVAANLSMLSFDIALAAAVAKLGGSYRRYSDDLLIIVPDVEQNSVRHLVLDLLEKHAGQLRINADKTAKVTFDLSKPSGVAFKPLQYLGFLFDSDRILIRPNTVSRHWRRVYREVRRTIRLYGKAQEGSETVRETIHMRRLLLKTTHLGSNNLIDGYAKAARQVTGSKAILRQFLHHRQKISKLIKGCF